VYNTPLYQRSPPWLQEFAISFRGASRKIIRENKRFYNLLNELEINQWLDKEQLLVYQTQKSLSTLYYAVENVPYYESLFKTHGWNIRDFQNLEDIKKLPVLTKNFIRTNGKMLLAKRNREIKSTIYTSGTTGSPLKLRQSLNAVILEHAHRWRQLHWAGFSKTQRQAWIRGDKIVPISCSKPPFWRMDYSDNMLMLSSFHLSEQNAKFYIEELEHFNPVLIRSYPSSILFLAKYLESKNSTYAGTNLKCIVTSSETLTEDSKKLIETRMNCRVFDWYGSAERVAAIGTCEHGKYHLLSDYGLCELLPKGNNGYEIVATGFENKVMPLIRYQIGDTIIIDPHQKDCLCGRSFPLIHRILGREDAYIKTPSGRRLGRLDHIFKGLNFIVEAQIVQDRLDEITIFIVPTEKFSSHERQLLIKSATHYLGEEIKVTINLVPNILRTKNGKFKSVICNI
jgi:phenylacetate-CoA ligase